MFTSEKEKKKSGGVQLWCFSNIFGYSVAYDPV